MLAKDIVEEARGLMDDAEQVTWGDNELVGYLNTLIADLCIETDVLEDSDTVGEVLAFGTITLDNAGGSIASVSVNGVVITGGAVPFNVSLTQTAADLAANINAFTSAPDYTATSDGAVVTVKARAGTGANPNGYEITVVASGGLTAATTPFLGGTSLCQIYLLPGVSSYSLDPKIIQVKRVKPSLQSWPLVKRLQSQLDLTWPNWETVDGDPQCYIADRNAKKIRIVPKPKVADVVNLTVTRVPLKRLSDTDMNMEPEIPAIYHEKLQSGVLWKAYSKLRYGQMVDPRKAGAYQGQWEIEKHKIKQDQLRREAVIETAMSPVPSGRQRW